MVASSLHLVATPMVLSHHGYLFTGYRRTEPFTPSLGQWEPVELNHDRILAPISQPLVPKNVITFISF